MMRGCSPMTLQSGADQQFWVTVHVPDEAAPGDYTGVITLTTTATVFGTLKLELTVLPFPLSAPYYQSSFITAAYCARVGNTAASAPR